MDASLLLRIWVLNELDLGVLGELGDFGEGNEVVDLLALVLEMEACVLESGGEVDNGLPDFVDLLLRRDLEPELVQLSGGTESCVDAP